MQIPITLGIAAVPIAAYVLKPSEGLAGALGLLLLSMPFLLLYQACGAVAAVRVALWGQPLSVAAFPSTKSVRGQAYPIWCVTTGARTLCILRRGNHAQSDVIVLATGDGSGSIGVYEPGFGISTSQI